MIRAARTVAAAAAAAAIPPAAGTAGTTRADLRTKIVIVARFFDYGIFHNGRLDGIAGHFDGRRAGIICYFGNIRNRNHLSLP